jgi:hypothetical protein
LFRSRNEGAAITHINLEGERMSPLAIHGVLALWPGVGVLSISSMDGNHASAESQTLFKADWFTASASCAVIEEGPSVVRVVMRGRMKTGLARSIVGALEGLFQRQKPLDLLWDLEAMEAYESAVRVECTNVLLSNWSNVKSVHALAKSNIVRMGVAVANLALGNRVVSHHERSTFEAALRDKLRGR